MTDRLLPPFPVDNETLGLLEHAINPWAHGDQAECSSLGSFLEFMSQLGGSDTSAVEVEADDGIAVMSDPQYAPTDVIQALVDEVRRQREELAGITVLEVEHETTGWHASLNDVLLVVIIVTGIVAAVVNA